MSRFLTTLLCAAGFWLCAIPVSLAQDGGQDSTGRSDEVEESDEAYRRRMELEDARQRNLGYTLPPETYVAQQDLLDKLPEASRDNVRDQLVDIIVENGEWEPVDALRDYPYDPTAAALGDADLLEQEQAAWDEQIEKYHKREAAAYGTYLGPAPGPGNPAGADGASQARAGGGTQGAGPAGPRQGGGSGETDGEREDGSPGSAGTYAPYSSSPGDTGEEFSTAGARQSALDYLRERQGAEAPLATAAPDIPAPASAAAGSSAAVALQNADEAATQQADSEDDSTTHAPESEAVELDLETPGIIPIEDLENLEGAAGSDRTDGAEPPP